MLYYILVMSMVSRQDRHYLFHLPLFVSHYVRSTSRSSHVVFLSCSKRKGENNYNLPAQIWMSFIQISILPLNIFFLKKKKKKKKKTCNAP
jgi:hypothetical protein